MITYVTAFYKLDERTYCSSSDYIRLFKPLADTGIHIHLFIQPKLYDMYIRDIGVRKNIHITQLEFEDLPIYQQLKNIELNLPEQRNIEKDTRDYMILINSKVEFVKQAIDNNHFSTKHFAWIDFGISKVVQHSSTLENLKNIIPKDGLYMPSIHSKTRIHFSHVCWRFCGGFFIGDIQSILKFHRIYETYFVDILSKNTYTLPWEVNIWAYLEYFGVLNVNTYPADHNDSMLLLRE